MERLTPSDVRNIAFRKPPIGKRGYDEQEVDEFLDRVESALTDMSAELASLRAQLGDAGGAVPLRGTEILDASQYAVLAELDLIKVRLTRIEDALLPGRNRITFGDATRGAGL
jgi:DivIVA domain-containing protein